MKVAQHSGIGMTSARTRERLVRRLQDQGIRNTAVLERIYHLPRHLFVDEALATRAYEDTALPIGHGQTISQPYIVARMTEALLENAQPRKILEVGTGCGYQTAVLAPLVPFIYSIERIGVLLTATRARLKLLKISNVQLRHGDGYRGWAGYAPFDAIVVTAAPEQIPQPLLDQLAPGGRLIAPIGSGGRQELRRITRRGDDFHPEMLGLVSFVPLVKGLS